MTTNSSADLRAQANELWQSDSALQQAFAQELFRQADELEGRTRPLPKLDAHVQAYRAAVAAEDRAAVLSSVSAKVRAALIDIQAGRMPSSHLRPTH